MWYPAHVDIAPTGEPVSIDEAKAHCRVSHNDDDTSIGMIIRAARSHAEGITGTRLASQTISIKCDSFDDLARMSEGPIRTVASIKYDDSDGVEQTLSTDIYEVRADGLNCVIALKFGQSWPSVRTGSRITVTAVAGYDPSGPRLPDAVKHAMLMMIGHWYENREAVNIGNITTTIPIAVDDLLINHRMNA